MQETIELIKTFAVRLGAENTVPKHILGLGLLELSVPLLVSTLTTRELQSLLKQLVSELDDENIVQKIQNDIEQIKELYKTYAKEKPGT